MGGLFWRLAFLVVVCVLFCQNANAATYHVGSGQTYTNLEELRQAAVASTITWDDGDEIILYNDDHSLTNYFEFNGKSITISSSDSDTKTILPQLNNVQFSLGMTGLTIADGSAITFNGFQWTTNAGNGGAIRNGGDVIISGTSTFQNNSVTYRGGAIYGGNVEISGDSTFTNNSAGYYGGAIYGNNVTISGTSTFSNNTDTSGSYGGGAIRNGGDVTISATTGDIVFTGNKAGSNPIAIHMNTGGKTLSLAATDGNKIEFYDLIRGSNLTIKINEDSSHTGTVLFDMSNNSGAGKNSDISGNTTVSYGTLALQGEAVYGASGNNGTFALQNDATLLSVGKNNKINSSGTVTLAGTLAFDLTGVGASDTALTFSGTTNSTAIKNVDIRVFNGQSTVNLAKTTNGAFDIAGTILTIPSELISNTRASSSSLNLADSGQTLQLINAPQNGTVTWTGNADSLWNVTSDNWTGTIGGAVTQFLHGDDVVFTDLLNGNHAINVQNSGVTIGSTMTFANKGTWTFTGGEIKGGQINVANGADAKIYFDTRSMNQRIEVDINATATIAATDGNTLTFDGFNNSRGGAINTASGSNLIIGTEDSSVVFNANSATGNNNGDGGGAIYSGGTVSIYGTSFFSNNTATFLDGGAIRSAGNITISGDSTFSNNSAKWSGGAIRSDGNGSSIIISGTSIFSHNSTDLGGGGAICGEQGNLSISGDSTFSYNSATSGGAISSRGNVTISDTSTFSYNLASEDGGTIWCSGGVSISGDSTVSNNSARNGGAIYSTGNVTISGTSILSDNSSSRDGGAIYSDSNLSITADSGDIVFTGNKANNIPNAIYMDNSGNNKTLSLAATSGNSVQFYDPITSNSSNSNLTIKINEQNNQTGTVLFDMSNNSGAGKNSDIYGNTTVNYGTLALKGEAVYGASGNNGTFALQNNATLLTTGKNNVINAKGNVTLNGTLAFENIDQTDGTLEFNSNGTINGTVTAIDIREILTDNQRYVLATNTGSANFSSLVLPTQIQYNGQSIENTRAENKILATTNDTEKTLVLLVNTLENTTVTWTGNTNSDWDISKRNWNGKLLNNDNVNQFLHGDNVTFSAATQKNIMVNSGGVNVDAMSVTENGYTFNGGNITGTSLNLNSSTTSETKFQNEINFTNGITVALNNTLTFDYNSNKTNNNQFSGAGTFKKTGTGKLTLSANDALTGNLAVNINNGELELTDSNNISGNINLGTTSSSKLTVNSVNNSTFAGTITGNGNLEKNGTGTLTLTGNNSATGNVTVNAGTLVLAPATTGNMTFNNPLSGSGTLAVDLVNTTDTFTLGTNAGTAFAGILEMRTGTFATSGFTQLANAELKLNTGSSTGINSNQSIRKLTLNGGQIEFTANPVTPTALLTVTDLDITATGGKVKDVQTNNINTATPSTTQNIFDYWSSAGNYQRQLVSVTNSITETGTITLDPTANTDYVRNLDGGGTAKFNYNINVDNSSANKGLYLGYGLVEIDNGGNNITLSTVNAANPKLTAKLTGAGNFIFAGNGNATPVEIGNNNSNYSGNTEINNLKIKMLDNNAFGTSAGLSLKNNAELDTNSHLLTVTQLDGDNNTKITLTDLTVTNGGTFAGQLTGNGNLTVTGGTLTLSHSGNNYSGTTTLNGGNLSATANDALSANSDYVVNNGTLSINNFTQTIKTLNGNTNGNINLGTTGNLTITNGGTFDGQISGNGNLTTTGGTLTLTGNHLTAIGTLNQTGGVVNLQNGWGGNYTLGNSATLNLSNSSPIGGNANLSGTIDIINGKLNVGGDLVLDSGSILKMTIAENKMTANSITIDDNTAIELSSIPNGTTNNVIVSNTPFTQTQLDKLNAKLTLTDKLLVSLRPVYNANLTTMGFESSSQSAEHYTGNNNFRNNQIEIAGLLDGYAPIQTMLQSLDTRGQLETLIRPLLVAELAAEAYDLPMYHPYFRVFNHINHLPANFANNNSRNNNFNTLLRGQSACSPVNAHRTKTNREFWFESYYQGGETDGNSNALGYKISRGGMMVGVDQPFGNKLLTGLVFGYGNPQVYNSVAKIEADDYTFGAYARIKISEIYANAFLGYGKQDYQLRQNSTNSNSQYNGDSMYASLELFKPFRLRNNIIVSPLAAIDFQKARSDGFNVNVTGLPLSVNKSDLEQTVLRIGVNSSYKNFRTRLQYGYQIAGDLYGNSRTSITGGSNNRILSGVNLGRHTFNAGFGGDFKIGNRTKLFADYDLDLGEHSTAHTGQFGFVRNF